MVNEPELSRRGTLAVLGIVAAPTLPSAAQAAEGKASSGFFEDHGSFYAGYYGVVGDGVADDTHAAQSFLDLCERNGHRIANFGGLKVRITGPLKAHNVGIVFSPLGIGVGPGNEEGLLQAGFYATSSGPGIYTALTVTGVVPDFQVTVYGVGAGQIIFDDRGILISDTRAKINGIQFGDVGVEARALASSVIRHARAFNLRGFGIRHVNVYDTIIMTQCVEWCGDKDVYAWSVEGDGGSDAVNSLGTCNESHWLRVQVERAAYKAIYISDYTLSCTFSKIHSERGTALRPPKLYSDQQHMWVLGGNCYYSSVRLHANNSAWATARVGGESAQFSILRAEQGVEIYCSGGNGTGLTLIEPNASLRPVPGQFGHITIIGGEMDLHDLCGKWVFQNARIRGMTVASCKAPGDVVAVSCVVENLAPVTSGAAATFINSEIRQCRLSGEHGIFDRLELKGSSALSVEQGRIGAGLVVLNDSWIIGDVVVQQAGLCLQSGACIDGSLTLGLEAECLADDGSYVTGDVKSWGPPKSARYFSHRRGMRTSNLSPLVGAPLGWVCVEGGRPGQAGQWRPTYNLA